MSEDNIRMGVVPSKDCAYSLEYTVPLQKVEGGYVLTNSAQDGVPLYLATDEDVREHQFLQGYAIYLGPVTYKAQNGFDHTMFTFMQIGPEHVYSPP
jgi:hypothetical protein